MELIGEFDRDVMNKIKNNNLQYNAHYFKHSDSKLNNNLIDMMCTMYTMSFDDNQLYSQKYLSPDNLRMIRTSLALNTINNTKDAYISFTNRNSGKKFKLFPRELSAEGIKLREFQKQQNESLKKDIENASKNKEA